VWDEYDRLTAELDDARKAVREHLETGVTTARIPGTVKMPERVIDDEWMAEHRELRAVADAAEDRLVAYLPRFRR